MFKTTMKNSLKYIALLSIAGASIATAAETAGLNVSALWGYQLPLIAFISALILMTFTTDYRRVSSLTFEPSLPNAILTPANKAFSAATPGHRVAAPRRIRRVRHQLVRN
jgi:hypothetical protein